MKNLKQHLNVEVTLIELLLWYWRSRLIVLATFCVGAVIASIWYFTSPQIYQIQASYYATLEQRDVRDQHSALLRTMPIAKFKARQRMLDHPAEYLNIEIDVTPPLHGHLPALIVTMRGTNPQNLVKRITKLTDEIINEVTIRTIRMLETENDLISDGLATKYEFYLNKRFRNSLDLLQLENVKAAGFEISKPKLFSPRLDRVIVLFFLFGFCAATAVVALNSMVKFVAERIRLRIADRANPDR